AIDGKNLIVGAIFDNNSAGGAYVFDLASTTPTAPVATLNNPNPSAQGSFGRNVAIAGKYAAVGAFFADLGAEDAGAAYVYDLSSASPGTPIATLTEPVPGKYHHFGSGVAISGSRLVVGAEHSGTSGGGTAFVYDLTSPFLTMPIAE